MKTKQEKEQEEKRNVFADELKTNGSIPEIKLRYHRSSKFFLGKAASSKDAADFFRKVFNPDTIQLQESFFLLLTNRANEIIGYYNVSIGGITGTVADPGLIFAAALLTASRGIILCHNHPSGNLKPSHADIELTKKIKEGGKLLDILLLDHIILSSTEYYSFADEGLI